MEEIVSIPHKVKVVDMQRLKPIWDKALADAGIVLPEKPISHEELMKLMIAEGVDPEQNIGSRDIIRARYCGED